VPHRDPVGRHAQAFHPAPPSRRARAPRASRAARRDRHVAGSPLDPLQPQSLAKTCEVLSTRWTRRRRAGATR
jgi:hypothetical protein